MDGSGEEIVEKTRRRSVQKKINFFLPSVANNADEIGVSSPDEAEGRRKSRRKAQSRSAGKIQVPSKDFGLNTRDKRSSLSVARGKQGSDFFLKISEKKLKYDQEVEVGDANKFEGVEGHTNLEIQGGECLPAPSSKGSPTKWWLKGAKTRMKDQTPEIIGECTPVIDLTRDEVGGGISSEGMKANHPFFSQRKKQVRESLPISKSRKKNIEADYMMTSSCPPIHISATLQELEDRVDSFDWGSWEISDISFIDPSKSVAGQSGDSTILPDSIGPLKFDSTISASNFHSDILACNRSQSDEFPVQLTEPMASEFTCGLSDDKRESTDRKPSIYKSDDQSEKVVAAEFITSQDKAKNELNDGFCNKSGSRHPVDSIGEGRVWTKKYRPERAEEVCGNATPVKFLVEWLTPWKEKNSEIAKSHLTSKHIAAATKEYDNDFEEISSDSYSDSENDDEYRFKNVLLITGPVGCGKTAAVYASARELGFNIIEVNASDVRNGAHIKQKFGEAMDSHGLQICSSFGSTDLESSTRHKGLKNALLVSEDVTPKDLGSSSTNQMSTCRVSNRNLFLFEDVDAILDEDRGLGSTIMQLAETSKRPIILTSNSKHTSLPSALETQVTRFTHPSKEQLLARLHAVCSAEGADVPHRLLEHLVITCQGDIRKTVLLLQFWCQGKKGAKDRSTVLTYSPLQFDLNAAHWVLETVLPWAIPCQLALKVEEEISKAVSSIEDDPIILNLPCFLSDESLPPKDEDQSFSDDLGSSWVYTEGFRRRAQQTIISSDEDANCESPVADTYSKLMPDEITSCSHVCDTYNSFCPETEISNREDLQCGEVDSLVNSVAEKAYDQGRMLLFVDEDTRMNFVNIDQAENLSVHRNEGPEIMDESSCVGFSMKIKAAGGDTPSKIINSVEQAWNSLRSCQELTLSNLSLDHRETFRILDIASRMTDLLSDADILLRRCQLLTSDVLESSETPLDDPCTSSFYDEHLDMASTFSQHGMCLYVSNAATSTSSMCYESPLHLGHEMLAASTCSMAVGKLLSQTNMISFVPRERGLQKKASRDLASNLCNATRPLVPARLQMMLHGPAFHEYTSCLSLISKCDNLRLSQGTNLLKPHRRPRVPRHYLASLPSPLSPGKVELFAQYGCYGSLDFR